MHIGTSADQRECEDDGTPCACHGAPDEDVRKALVVRLTRLFECEAFSNVQFLTRAPKIPRYIHLPRYHVA